MSGMSYYHNVPESIEAYYQEAGRAGCDGDPAACHLLWNGYDFGLRRFFIERDMPKDALSVEEREFVRKNRYRLLANMEGYCQTTGCLRAYILRYFGDEGALGVELDREDARASSLAGGEYCGNCLNCLGEFETEDVTEAARAVLRVVQATGGRFGKAMAADILHGLGNEKIRQFHLESAAGYAVLASMPVRRIRDVVDRLVGRGYLEQSQGRFPVIGLGPLAAEVLEPGAREGEAIDTAGAGPDESAFSFTIKRRAANSCKTGRGRCTIDLVRDEASLDAPPRVGDDVELFELLRALRLELAAERGAPAYIICSDATLRGLCRRRPATYDGLLEVRGIDEKKAEAYGDRLLGIIVEYEASIR